MTKGPAKKIEDITKGFAKHNYIWIDQALSVYSPERLLQETNQWFEAFSISFSMKQKLRVVLVLNDVLKGEVIPFPHPLQSTPDYQ